jgi:hypothetical protein
LWETGTYGEPVAAPLERVAELHGVDLAVAIEAAKQVPPYTTATGEPRWSVQLIGVVLGVRESERNKHKRRTGQAAPWRQRQQTTCKRGHSLTDPANTRVRPDARRTCRACQREQRQTRRVAVAGR